MTTQKNVLVASIIAALGLAVGVSSYAMKGGNFGLPQESGSSLRMMNHDQSGSGSQFQGSHMGKKGKHGSKGGMGMMGGMPGMQMKGQQPMMSEAMRSAVQANDYDAFSKAWNEQQATVQAPTQEQFSQQVKMFTAHQAVENAVTANDYEGFKKAIAAMPKPVDKDGKEITDAKERPVPTAEQFAKMVEGKKAQQTVENAVTANDYEAFKKAIAAMPKPLDKNGKEIADANKRPVPTAEQFAKMVEGKKKQQAIETTLKANDYNAFLTTWTANKPTLPTKEEFTKIVENKDTHQGKEGMMKGKKGGKGKFGKSGEKQVPISQ